MKVLIHVPTMRRMRHCSTTWDTSQRVIATAFAECDARGWHQPIVYVTECAWKYNDAPDVGWALADIAAVNDEYLKDPEVQGRGIVVSGRRGNTAM